MRRHLAIAALLIAACFGRESTLGFPCSGDLACDDELVCTDGFCRFPDDPEGTGTCRDGARDPGEFCYDPDDRQVLQNAGVADSVVIDLDGDGDDDVVSVGGVATDFATGYLSDGTGQFTPLRLGPGRPPGVQPTDIPAVVAGEFDDRPGTDLVVRFSGMPPDPPFAAAVPFQMYMFPNPAGAAPGPVRPVEGSVNLDNLGALIGPFAGQFDADPAPDLLLLGDDRADLYSGTADSFAIPQSAGTNGADRAFVGRIDGDELDDLLIANGGAAQLEVWFATESGTFTEGSPIRADGMVIPDGGGLGDLDDDGNVDIVLVRNGSEEVNIAFGEGDGRFETPVVADCAGGASAQIADIDGDGLSDLVVLGDDGLFVCAGFGRQLWVPVPIGQGGARFEIAEFNLDGAPDIVAGAGMSRALGVLLSSP